MASEKSKKAKIREEKGRIIKKYKLQPPYQTVLGEPLVEVVTDTLKEMDMQTPPDQIDKAPDTAMQEKEPFITQDIEAVRFDGLYPNPNGDPFDNMYKRQRKA